MNAIRPALIDALPEMTAWRHRLHMHPELGFEEVATSAFVAERLESWGIEVQHGIARTGLVGTIRGRPGAGAIGLRADMDALPIEEAGSLAHRSQVPGTMHACGHDGHTVMLLGAARYLAETRDFDGTVHLIFQPAEEGQGGARTMVAEGLFDRFPCDAVFALHNRPNMALGSAAVNHGVMLAGTARIDITVRGVGGHSSRPHLTVDPVVVAASLIQSLQAVVSRRLDPLEPAVVSITTLAAGNAINVIPDHATMTGTARYFSISVRERMRAELTRICAGVALANDAEIDFTFDEIVPATVNDPVEADHARAVLVDLLGEENVTVDGPPAPGGEDFAYMLEARPGAHIFLGMKEDVDLPMIHHPAYDFNDKLLPIGASYFVNLVEARLKPA